MNLSKAELKYLRALSQKKFRDAEKKFILEGWRPLKEALESEYRIELVGVLRTGDLPIEHQSILREISKRGIPLKDLKQAEIDRVSDTVHSQGVIAIVDQPHSDLTNGLLQTARVIVALDRVSDPGNLGTILRTCAWFGVDVVLLSEGCVSLYNEKVVRSTAGSIFHLCVVEGVELARSLKELKEKGFVVASTAAEAETSTSQVRFTDKTVLVLGSEANGIQDNVRQLSNFVVNIPKYGKGESLNVGVACGILLSEISRSLTQKS